VAATERAARSMGLQVTILEVPRADLLHGAFDAASRARVGALMVLGSPAYSSFRDRSWTSPGRSVCR